MELGGNGGNIQNSVIDYLSEFYNADIPILLFNEEELFYTLKYTCLRKKTNISRFKTLILIMKKMK